ncbi:MAG TPA: IclR family transcriptional regulator [Bauldia sp.]|nr:IclR family transcriptional regulator [Bauldia sp.]
MVRKSIPAEKPDAAADRGSLKSMRKLMAILDCFSPFDRSLTLNEISARCGMPKTTVHRLVTSLREVKLLEQDRERDRYRMGIRLFELGSIVLGHLDIYREARPLVDRLIGATGEGSHLCVFDGTNMVSIDHLEPNSASVNWTTTLSISPAYCTGVGKAALAFQEPAVIEKIIKAGLLPYTPSTITQPDALRKELALTRERGYSIDEGEHQPGIRCVAAPIFNSAGRAFAAISVTGPKDRVTPERVPFLAGLVIATAKQLSRQLGYEEKAEATS